MVETSTDFIGLKHAQFFVISIKLMAIFQNISMIMNKRITTEKDIGFLSFPILKERL